MAARYNCDADARTGGTGIGEGTEIVITGEGTGDCDGWHIVRTEESESWVQAIYLEFAPPETTLAPNPINATLETEEVAEAAATPTETATEAPASEALHVAASPVVTPTEPAFREQVAPTAAPTTLTVTIGETVISDVHPLIAGAFLVGFLLGVIWVLSGFVRLVRWIV